MPLVKQRMPTYREFALATLEEIYTPQTLEQAQVLKAEQLASGVLLNESDSSSDTPVFTFKPLPRIAQAAPGYGITLNDLDGDGHTDIFMVQNFRNREPETGYWTGGLSQLLLGDGHGNFNPVSPDKSGLIIPGDGRGLTYADINHDGKPDLTITQNEDSVRAFTNNSSHRFLAVRLVGPPGNPNAVGARITITSPATVAHQTAEVAAGSGYLSQSAPTTYFGLGSTTPPSSRIQFTVRWPDGQTTNHTTQPDQKEITITQRPQ
jgi:hypothetical protein